MLRALLITSGIILLLHGLVHLIGPAVYLKLYGC